MCHQSAPIRVVLDIDAAVLVVRFFAHDKLMLVLLLLLVSHGTHLSGCGK